MPRFSLVRPDRLAASLAGGEAVLVDTRPAADHWLGHLPTARSLDASLVVLPRTDAASVARFQALLGFALSALGVERGSRVIVHGAAGEVNVSRVAWALAYAGVEDVALLDGGLKALPGATLVKQALPVTPTRFVVEPVARLLATLEEVRTAAGHATLVDARLRDEFLGQRSNAKRHGRIPGALHWDTRAEVDGEDRLLAPPGLAALGAPGQRRIVYCGGGGRAARTFVALQLAGQTDAAVYPGSWNEWGEEDGLPIETGEPRTATA